MHPDSEDQLLVLRLELRQVDWAAFASLLADDVIQQQEACLPVTAREAKSTEFSVLVNWRARSVSSSAFVDFIRGLPSVRGAGSCSALWKYDSAYTLTLRLVPALPDAYATFAWTLQSGELNRATKVVSAAVLARQDVSVSGRGLLVRGDGGVIDAVEQMHIPGFESPRMTVDAQFAW